MSSKFILGAIAFSAAALFVPGCLAESSRSSGAEPPSGEARIAGRVIHQSDVSTIPNSPYREGAVLAISGQNWRRRVTSPTGESRQPGEGASVTEDQFANAVTAWDSLDPEGAYSLSVRPGSYAVCVANLGDARSPPPARLHGCAEIEVAAGEVLSIEFSFGEAGLRFTIERRAPVR